jgi:hypothetical protein
MFSAVSRREEDLHLEGWIGLVPAGSRHFATSGFGDLLFVTPDSGVTLVKTQYGVASPLPTTAEAFFDWLILPEPMFRVLDDPMWDERCAVLQPDEVLASTPALALGGVRSWERSRSSGSANTSISRPASCARRSCAATASGAQ